MPFIPIERRGGSGDRDILSATRKGSTEGSGRRQGLTRCSQHHRYPLQPNPRSPGTNYLKLSYRRHFASSCNQKAEGTRESVTGGESKERMTTPPPTSRFPRTKARVLSIIRTVGFLHAPCIVTFYNPINSYLRPTLQLPPFHNSD